jgi:hypothetical protein
MSSTTRRPGRCGLARHPVWPGPGRSAPRRRVAAGPLPEPQRRAPRGHGSRRRPRRRHPHQTPTEGLPPSCPTQGPPGPRSGCPLPAHRLGKLRSPAPPLGDGVRRPSSGRRAYVNRYVTPTSISTSCPGGWGAYPGFGGQGHLCSTEAPPGSESGRVPGGPATRSASACTAGTTDDARPSALVNLPPGWHASGLGRWRTRQRGRQARRIRPCLA